MKKGIIKYICVLLSLPLLSCSAEGGVGTTTTRYFVPKVTDATTAETTTTTPAETTAKEPTYIDGYYAINYTTKTIHRSGCDKLLTDSGQDFDIMVKSISHDLIDKKHFSTCSYCNPELPAKEEKSYEMSALYLKFFDEYAANVGNVAPRAVAEKLRDYPDYTVKHTESGTNSVQSYTITDESGDYVYMTFYPRWKGDAVEGLDSLTYHHGDKEITATDNTHISDVEYYTYAKNRKPARKQVNGMGDLEAFMFAE